jgi:hypothetical protein
MTMAKKSRHQIALEERIQELQARELEWIASADQVRKEADEAEEMAEGFRRTREVLQSILDSVDSGDDSTTEASD